MTIPTLPPAPSRSQASETFALAADAFVAALPAWGVAVQDRGDTADAAATAASLSAIAAAAAEAMAVAATNAAVWVSGTTYAVGDVRWSPSTYYSYRRKTAGAGTTDPSADPTNWAQLVTLPSTTGHVGKSLNVNAAGDGSEWGYARGIVPVGGAIFASFTSPDYTDAQGAGWLRNGFVVDTNAVAAAALDDFGTVSYYNFLESAALPASLNWTSITCSPSGLFCALPEASGNIAATSPDGVTWTQRSLGVNNDWIDVACNSSGLFCALRTGSGLLGNFFTSPNGITWTLRGTTTQLSLQRLTVSPSGLFCAVSQSTVYTSPDAITWTARNISEITGYGSTRAIAVSPSGLFCITTGSTSATVLTSTDPTADVAMSWGTAGASGGQYQFVRYK